MLKLWCRMWVLLEIWNMQKGCGFVSFNVGCAMYGDHGGSEESLA